MKRLALLVCMIVLPVSYSSAQPADLVMPGEKWIATFDKYVCEAFGQAVTRPKGLDDLNVTFERVTTDQTLDNALLRATFEENGKTCRYNAILFADNAAQDVHFVQSVAYNPEGDATAYRDCVEGKAVLDAALQSNDYLYYGHPHNLAIMMPVAGAEGVCGEGNALIGVNFVVTGRIQQ